MKLLAKAAGTIPTQNYGNYQPEYSVELEMPEGSDPKKVELNLRIMREIVENLYAERDRQFREIMEKKQSKPELVRELKVRWYPVDGKEYPSVTSILNPFGLQFSDQQIADGWTPEELEMYALRGTIVHWQNELWLKTGEWPEASTHPDYERLMNYDGLHGKIDPKDCNPRGIWQASQGAIEVTEIEGEVVSKKYRYAGRFDYAGTYNGLRAIMDLKTASNYKSDKKDEYFMQMAGYDIARIEAGKNPAEIYVILPANPSNKQGYGAPLVCNEPEKYRKLFLKKVAEFYALPEVKNYIKIY